MDEDAEEFKVMRSKPLPSIEDLMSGKPNQQDAKPTQPYHKHYLSETTQLKSTQPQTLYMRLPLS